MAAFLASSLLAVLIAAPFGTAAAGEAAVPHPVRAIATSGLKLEPVFAGTLRSPLSAPSDGSAPDVLDVAPGVAFGYLGPLPLRRTDVITARIGVEFGLLFVPEAGSGALRYILRLPAKGAQGPSPIDDSALDCLEGVVCNASFKFERPEEIVPGDWDIEVRTADGHVLTQHAFHVVPADAAQPPTTVTAVLPDIIEIDGERHATWTWALEPWLAGSERRERLSLWQPMHRCALDYRGHVAHWSLAGDRLMLHAVEVPNCTDSPLMLPLGKVAPGVTTPLHADWVSGDIVVAQENRLSVAPPIAGAKRRVLILHVRDGIVRSREARTYAGGPPFVMRTPGDTGFKP